jgi:hypothetical protein
LGLSWSGPGGYCGRWRPNFHQHLLSGTATCSVECRHRTTQPNWPVCLLCSVLCMEASIHIPTILSGNHLCVNLCGNNVCVTDIDTICIPTCAATVCVCGMHQAAAFACVFAKHGGLKHMCTCEARRLETQLVRQPSACEAVTIDKHLHVLLWSVEACPNLNPNDDTEAHRLHDRPSVDTQAARPHRERTLLHRRTESLVK